MSFLQPAILLAIPLIALPVLIHLVNQWRYQTRNWAPMMFLVMASRTNRGMAKIRQWMILAMRTLAVAGLLFAVSRPLVGGFWSILAGGNIDTTIVLLDRSPSMSELGTAGESKLQVASNQLESALSTVGSSRWVAIDTATAVATEYLSLGSLLQSPASSSSSAQAQFPKALLSALEYVQVNQPGSIDVWLCSDLQSGDWRPGSTDWSQIRSGFGALPQQIRFSVLAYSDRAENNLAIRVNDAYWRDGDGQTASVSELVLSIEVNDTSPQPSSELRTVPVEVEVEGVRTQIQVEMKMGIGIARELKIPLPTLKTSGWGRVSLPADANALDNEYFFVFEDSSAQRVVLVTDAPDAAIPLQIAASVDADGGRTIQLEILSPARVSSSDLDGVALVIWQADLPDQVTASSIDRFVACGGRIVFFPPAGLQNGTADQTRAFHGIRWVGWKQPGANPVMISNWRGDQDLLAATQSGAGLPVGQLEILGYGLLQSEQRMISLATLDGGDALLARYPTNSGGVYFCSAGTKAGQSSLAENGVVLFVVVQRAIQDGQAALGRIRQRDAESLWLTTSQSPMVGMAASETDKSQPGIALPPDLTAQHRSEDWQQIAGPRVLSSEFDIQSGIYKDSQRLFAVNRPKLEDQPERLEDSELSGLFEGLQMNRIDQQAGGSNAIFREVWRLFLSLVVLALLVEAALCLPRIRRPLVASQFSLDTKSMFK